MAVAVTWRNSGGYHGVAVALSWRCSGADVALSWQYRVVAVLTYARLYGAIDRPRGKYTKLVQRSVTGGELVASTTKNC